MCYSHGFSVTLLNNYVSVKVFGRNLKDSKSAISKNLKY